MNIKDLMTKDVATCSPDASLEDCAKKMLDNDCGMIPIVAGNGQLKPVGAITDRDICIRTIAKGINPLDCNVEDIMTKNPVTIDLNASHEEAIDLMENKQIRRLIVIDDNGECCGILSQADLARNLSGEDVAEVVQHVSEPSGDSSNLDARS